MTQRQIINKTAKYVRSKLIGEGSGHDWWHIYRVWKCAVRIGKRERADLFVVELAALLHDIADWKFHGGDIGVGSKMAGRWLKKLSVDEDVTAHVCRIIGDISFKGAGVRTRMKTKEGMVVQDADRLDAMGAMGISRTFAYGGHAKREIHNPDVKPRKHASFAQYKKSQSTSINHFYEKLLLLQGLMNTATARKIAAKRHRFMEKFLAEFFREWEGRA